MRKRTRNRKDAGPVPLPPAPGAGGRDRWISKLEASFVYTDCYKLARDTQWEHVSKKGKFVSRDDSVGES